MWKYVRRSLREAIGCREHQRITSGRIWDFNRSSDQPTASQGNESGYQRRSANWSSLFCRDPTEFLLSTVTCSSALALGWVLTKPFLHARKWRCDGGSRCIGCVSLFNGRRPLLVALAQGSDSPKCTSNAADPPQITSGEQSSVPYGPITAEQAVEEAAHDFGRAHDIATAAAANLRGIELAASGSPRKRRQAYRAFLEAYNATQYAPAAYNIAQCHELGIGTQQSFTDAVHWYKIGADSGHAGATYNLAVFYAHGWGGLNADSSKARQLLIRAAELGSSEARASLGRQPDISSQVGEKAGTEWTREDVPETPEASAENDSNDYCSTTEFSSDPEKIYNLAQSFERSPDNCDAHLVMELYGFASDLGHKAAAAKLQILKAYEAVGLLSEFLWGGHSDKSKFDNDFTLLETRQQ